MRAGASGFEQMFSVPTASERIFPVSCCDRSIEKDRPGRVDIQELLTHPLILIYYKEESYRGQLWKLSKTFDLTEIMLKLT